MMKSITIIVLFGISSVMAVDILHNGQPGCKTTLELNTVLFKNNWDPTAYWVCKQRNQPAVAVRCPDEQAFQSATNKCVPWEEWNWTVPQNPPSRP